MSNSNERGVGYWWIGPVFMALVVANVALHRGVWWEFGPRFGMPVTLLAADGFHRLDGSPASPIDLALKRPGIEEEVLLVMLILFLVLMSAAVRIAGSAERMQTPLAESLRRDARGGPRPNASE